MTAKSMRRSVRVLCALAILMPVLSCEKPGPERAGDQPAGATGEPLRLYAGAGLRRAVDELVAEFAREQGIRVEPDYGGSGVIITRAREDDRADLFMPGDVWYVDRLDELAGLVEERATVAYLVPVIIVRKGNPLRIGGIADLYRDGVSVALGHADACQVGRITDKILALNGHERAPLKPKESLTVNELGVWVKTGDVDAAIVWDAIAANIADSVDVVPIPAERNVISRVVVGLMKTSRNKAAARRFIEFMTGENGRAILNANGYRTDEP